MGKKTSKSTQTVSIPPEVLARYNAVNTRAEAAANTPYKLYGGEFVAGLTDTQKAGMAGINAAANQAQPYYASATNYLQNAQSATQPYFSQAGNAYNAGLAQGQDYLGAATGAAQQGGQAVNASDLDAAAINKYMSPYLQNVLQGTAGLLNQQNQQAMSGQLGNAVRQGAFGGDRGGIAAANLAQQQRLADASIFSNLLNQGYNTALSTAAGQQALNLSAAQANRTAQQSLADRLAALGQQGFNQYSATGQNVQGLGKDIYNTGAATSKSMADLGTGAQNAAIQGAQAQMNAGAVEQATKQAEDTAYYNQFKEQQSYPFQVAQFLANIAEGTGALSGSTTTTAQPGGFFSDERMKENIQKVGKTYDGQHIYRYNYKGDPTTHIGLIAQEVEHHHPEAVGLAGGMKTVDYDKATDEAAQHAPHKGLGGFLSSPAALWLASPLLASQMQQGGDEDPAEKALGGASMGGGVTPLQAGQGFADGGLAGDPAYMMELYKQLFALGANRGINGMQGIPVTPGDIPELMVAKGIEGLGGNKVADAVNAVDAIGQLGGRLGAWRYGRRPQEEPRRPMDERLPAKPDTPPLTYDDIYPQAVATGGFIEDPQEKAGLGAAAVEASKPQGGLGEAAPSSGPPAHSDIPDPIMPKVDTPQKDIKFGQPSGTANKLAVADAPVKPTNHGSQTLSDLANIAKIASAFIPAGAAHGGRIHRDMGGGMPYASDSQSIVPNQAPEQHQLMTAQGTSGGGGGGAMGAVGKIAGAAANFIPGGGIAKKVLGGIGSLFSDERVKENIRPIGELFDGQKVYSYNLKGDNRTQIGLLAQEVEHHNPHAVGHSGGLKTVDYHDATQHAAHRGHFAYGGEPEEDSEITSPTLLHLMQTLNPLGVKTTGLPEKKALSRQNNFWSSGVNDGPMNKGLIASAEPEPVENMMPTRESLETKEKKPGLENAVNDFSEKPETRSLPTNVMQIARLIHAAEGNGAAETSSARGRYGITSGTYHTYFKRAFPQQAEQLGYSGIEQLRKTPKGEALNEQFGPMIISDNANFLRENGFEPNAQNVYLAHFLGPGGARSVLKALAKSPNTPVEMAINKESIDANPWVFGHKNNVRTVGQLVKYVGGRMAEMDKYLRNRRADGGLVGRNGYQTAGTVLDPDDPANYQGYAAPDEAALAKTQFPADKIPSFVNMDFYSRAKAEREGYSDDPNQASPEYKALAQALDTESANRAGSNANNGQVSSQQNVSKSTDLPPEPPAKRAGLVSRVFGYDPAHPYQRGIDPQTNMPKDNNFFHRLGHGETDAVLAAIQGLAAMGTAPTRSLGVALATGLGAGAQAYQQQRQFGLEGRKTAAQEMQAKATAQQAQNEALQAKASWKTAVAGGYNAVSNWLDKAQNTAIKLRNMGAPDTQLEALISDGRKQLFAMQQSGLGGSSVPPVEGAAPAPGLVPQAQTPQAQSPAPQVQPPQDQAQPPQAAQTPAPQAAQDDSQLPEYTAPNIQLPNENDPAAMRAYAAKIAPFDPETARLWTEKANALDPLEAVGNPKIIDAEAQARYKNETLGTLSDQMPKVDASLSVLNQFADAVEKLPGAWQGPLSAQIQPLMSGLNQLSQALGMPPIFDPQKIARGEDAAKQSQRLVSTLTAAFRGTAGEGVMNNIMSEVPTMLNSKEGASRLVSSIRQANRATHAQYEYALNYKGDDYRRMYSDFNRTYPPEYWNARVRADQHFSSPENRWVVEAAKKDPKMNFKIKGMKASDYFNKNYRGIGGAAGVLNIFQGMW
jgi:hypothetical protein